MLKERGYIYASKHEGWYSISDEAFYPSSAVQLALDPSTGRKFMVWLFKFEALSSRLNPIRHQARLGKKLNGLPKRTTTSDFLHSKIDCSSSTEKIPSSWFRQHEWVRSFRQFLKGSKTCRCLGLLRGFNGAFQYQTMNRKPSMFGSTL